jgi:hypothetical protein
LQMPQFMPQGAIRSAVKGVAIPFYLGGRLIVLVHWFMAFSFGIHIAVCVCLRGFVSVEKFIFTPEPTQVEA